MNILVLTPWFPDHPNDQHGNFILDSVESLCEIGHRVHVFVTRPFMRHHCSDIQPEMFARGFAIFSRQYFSIPRNFMRFVSNWLYVLGCRAALREIVLKKNIDVIHAHTEIAGYLAGIVANETGIPVVTTVHGINLDRRYLYGLGQSKFFKKVFSKSKRLILVGEPLFSFIKKYISEIEHVRVVHNGFRTKDAVPFKRRKVFSSPEDIQLISVSNLVDGKGIDINLAALGHPEIVRLSNWNYHIVGDGPLRIQLEEQAQEFGIADRVTFHGRCTHDKVYQLLSGCDVFSLPSAPEAFGVAYLEAMACGLLTIGVEREGPSNFIQNNHTGLLIRERDVVDLVSVFLDIFNYPWKYKAIAKAGREHVWENYSWHKHAEALSSVFKEAVESRQ